MCTQHATRITYLDEPKQRLRTKRAKPDHVVIAAAIRQWRRQSVQISDVCFGHLAVFRTCCNQMDSNLANLEATVKVG